MALFTGPVEKCLNWCFRRDSRLPIGAPVTKRGPSFLLVNNLSNKVRGVLGSILVNGITFSFFQSFRFQ